jgi:hypothetical protein
VEICSPEFAKALCRGQSWFSSTFVAAFGLLAHHGFHSSNMQYIACEIGDIVTATVPTDMWNLKENVEFVVASCYTNNHFVVLCIDIRLKLITVYDGLSHNPAQWTEHARYLLWKVGLQQPDNTSVPVVMDPKSKAAPGHPEWYMQVAATSVNLQNDHHSCGPIACLYLTYILSGFQDDLNPTNVASNTWRRNVHG